MSCSTMLDQILDADLDVLDGTGDADLARHVRECARCRVIARTIIGDTRSLAVAVAHVRATTTVAPITAARSPIHPRRRGRVRAALATGLAAALCAVVVREWTRRDASPQQASRVAVVERPSTNVASVAMPPATAIASRRADAPRVRPRPRQRAEAGVREAQPLARAMPHAPATVAERTIVEPVGLPTAVAPVRIDPMSHIALGSGVAVDPPTGTRATIIRTPNPTVTVVWLYQ